MDQGSQQETACQHSWYCSIRKDIDETTGSLGSGWSARLDSDYIMNGCPEYANKQSRQWETREGHQDAKHQHKKRGYWLGITRSTMPHPSGKRNR